MTTRRIIVTKTQVPFVRGGAEVLVEALCAELRRAGIQVETVGLPYTWHPAHQIFKSYLNWRLLNFTTSNGMAIDGIIGTKFPAYAAYHPNKIIWLFHQHRQFYDLFGQPLGDFANTPINRVIQWAFQQLDRRVLLEAKHLFTISQNVADRLVQYNRLSATPLPPPPLNAEKLYFESYGSYVFSPNRFESNKRLHLIVEAMHYVTTPVTCILAGWGPMHDILREQAVRLGVADKVHFPGYVSDDEIRRLYANCLAVPYTPFDEDYGYVTIEAFLSRKPVLTMNDSGGPLEYVRHTETGYIVSSPQEMAERIDTLYHNRALCARLGEASYERVRNLSWPRTVEMLLARL